MSNEPTVDAEAGKALGMWAAQAVALVIADLNSRRLIDPDLVEHLSDMLFAMEQDAPSEWETAFDHVALILRGDHLPQSPRFERPE